MAAPFGSTAVTLGAPDIVCACAAGAERRAPSDAIPTRRTTANPDTATERKKLKCASRPRARLSLSMPCPPR